MNNELNNSEQNWIWDQSIQPNNNKQTIDNQQLNYSFWHQQNLSPIKIPKNNILNLYNEVIPTQIQNNSSLKLVVIKQPEEQHRARYASEGSRGAVKDRSGISYCSIQLFGYYRPTRVEIFAAEREVSSSNPNISSFVPHSQYKLIPVVGKSSTEIILRPENQMIGILDCIGIMKICAYNNNKTFNKYCENKKHSKCRKRPRQLNEDEYQIEKDFEKEFNNNNILYIVARAYVPLESNYDQQNYGNDGKYEIIQTVTEPIKCVHQLGNPDILKISLESCTSNGGQELFIIGRNFDPKNTNCYIVCTVPPYQSNFRGSVVSLTVVCGSKQSHPINFLYKACEVEDDDWRPPDCSLTSNAECSSSQLAWSSSISVPHQQANQNYFYDESINVIQQQKTKYSFNNSYQNKDYTNKNNFDIHPFIINSNSGTYINQQ
uniref:IPT/TIG domain-containing protein n=1 Tax=Meloidogyne hapla TaxID=6305 RepID=A0A1I8BHW6_MELHA